ncbi:oleate hydratase [Cellulophaga baltica]|uniref:Oleate hydratase n=2 Tax=Cellulophaga baltica TaxID=76594 RepID=A0A1G7GTL2_9FLAO|nr:oleate hydratase [Cellulophaga baltica]
MSCKPDFYQVLGLLAVLPLCYIIVELKRVKMSKETIKAYCLGGGLGSLAAAAFMIRDGGMLGSQITIFEKLPSLGGCLDGARLEDGSYSLRGGRMLTTDAYECFWGLFQDIPSIHNKGISVNEETIAFNKKHIAHSQARLVDKNRHIVDTATMNFTMHDRLEFLTLLEASEEKLGTSKITDWLSPEFFTTNFWYMWQTTFAFEPWHSAVEFKRYLHRFMNEFPRINTLAGVKRTEYNQYDSLVRPLQAWLQEKGVNFELATTVDDIAVEEIDGKVTVISVSVIGPKGAKQVAVAPDDLVIFQNGSMVDASSIGSMEQAPAKITKADSKGWTLWEKLAKGRPDFGNPAPFNTSIPESFWESFTVTFKTSEFFDKLEKMSGNKAGTGGLVTFKDSSWLMSVVLYNQPHFIGQPDDVFILWGYALYGNRVGDFVPKTMIECNGQEILTELAGHLNFDDSVFEGAICVPCRMPYITSMFMPRATSDRPKPVPASSKNLAFVSQFVEIPDDVVFTVEYSVRAAQTAVYQLLNIDREIPKITKHDKSPKVLLDSVIKSFA